MTEKPSVDFNDEKFQREEWEKQRKSIVIYLKKLNMSNIKEVIFSLFKIDLSTCRGIFVKSIMIEQDLNQDNTIVYASLVAVLNSRIPMIGNLLIKRLINKFKLTLQRGDTVSAVSNVKFIAQLVNFKVADPLLALQIIINLLDISNPFNIQLVYELLNLCGSFLMEEQAESVNKIYQKLRILLTEGLVSNKGQLLIQKCMQIRKLEFETNEKIPDDLDLVEDDDIITHKITFNEDINIEDNLDVFNFDPNFETHHKAFLKLKTEILGDDDEEEEDKDDKPDTKGDESEALTQEENKVTDEIIDLSDSKLLQFQKTVYLTIMSSLGPEEATHKLMKVDPIDPKKKEYMLVDMILKCCTQEKTYSKYYGLIGEELIVKGGKWPAAFNTVFTDTYENCGKFDTTLLRNIGKFWGHMFASDKMGWEVLSCVKLTEEETTSSGRILLKFLFQRMLEELGSNKLISRLNERFIQQHLNGIFPHEDAEHLRFSINFFTAIGLGKLTDRMRTSLQSIPTQFIDDQQRGRSRSVSQSRSRSSSRSRSNSYSRSRSPSPSRGESTSDSGYRERLPTGPRSSLPSGPRNSYPSNSAVNDRYQSSDSRNNYRTRNNNRGNYGGRGRGRVGYDRGRNNNRYDRN